MLQKAQSEEILCKIVGKRQEKAPIDLANYLGPQFSDHFNAQWAKIRREKKFSVNTFDN